VPAPAIAEMQKEGAGFAGFATWLDMTPAHPDMFAKPDPASAIQLPWKPEVAWVAADLMDGRQAVAQAPRVVLKRQIAKAAPSSATHQDRRRVRVLPDHARRQRHLRPADTRVQALLRPAGPDAPLRRDQGDLRRMLELGWKPYQNDHEDANGQFEMNWEYDDALVTADRHVLLQVHGPSIAEKHGLRATFMPKPFKPDRQRLPRARLGVGQGRQDQRCSPTRR
jgi:glutamine synthetase